MKNIVLVFVCIFTLSSFTYAADSIRYVDADSGSDGNNSGNCGLSWAQACLNIKYAVEKIDTGGKGGMVFLSAGTFVINNADGSADNDPVVIDKAPVSIIGAGPHATIIELVADTDSGTPDVAITITDIDNPSTTNKDNGSYSVIQDLKLTVAAEQDESNVGGIEIDGAELVTIDNVWIDGFGDLENDQSLAATSSTSPFAIKVHASLAASSDDFDFADWGRINNCKLTHNYRGMVFLGGGNGYVKNTTIQDTAPGAAVHIVRGGSGKGTNWDFMNAQFINKSSATGSPSDAKYLVYIGYSDSSLPTGNSSFINTFSAQISEVSDIEHFRIEAGQNQWINHVFLNGEVGIQMSGTSPYPTRDVVGHYIADGLGSADTVVNTASNLTEEWTTSSY